MKLKCINESCKLYKKEVVIDNPTPFQEPKYGLTMYKEMYCKECNQYGEEVSNSKGVMVKVSDAQNGKIY